MEEAREQGPVDSLNALRGLMDELVVSVRTRGTLATQRMEAAAEVTTAAARLAEAQESASSATDAITGHEEVIENAKGAVITAVRAI